MSGSRTFGIAAAFLACCLPLACGGGSSSSAEQQLTGAVKVEAPDLHELTPTLESLSESDLKRLTQGQLKVPCPALTGVDIGKGTSVEVDDGDGHTLAATTLDAGIVLASGGMTGCEFDFSTKVKDSSAFYKVSVGGHGTQTYSKEDLAGDNWNVELKLGS